MKTKSAILIIVAFMLGGLSLSAKGASYSDRSTMVVSIPGSGSMDQVKVTGTTSNENGQNTTISLRVTGSSTGLNNYVIYVEYEGGGEWKKVQFNYVLGQKGKYYVTIDSKTYYFEY